jgi:hypothetical protein
MPGGLAFLCVCRIKKGHPGLRDQVVVVRCPDSRYLRRLYRVSILSVFCIDIGLRLVEDLRPRRAICGPGLHPERVWAASQVFLYMREDVVRFVGERWI